jgi:hypothetical protein
MRRFLRQKDSGVFFRNSPGSLSLKTASAPLAICAMTRRAVLASVLSSCAAIRRSYSSRDRITISSPFGDLVITGIVDFPISLSFANVATRPDVKNGDCLRRFGEDHPEIANAQTEFVVIDNETGEDVTRVL